VIDLPALSAAFTRQAGICRSFKAPLCAALLERCAADLADRGPLAELVSGWKLDPVLSSLPLRVLAAVHEEALAGAAPALARCYPTLGGVPDADAAWAAFHELVATRRPVLRSRLPLPPQTNEVNRCAVLVPGLLMAAERTRLPLRLLEIGASAGLNLRCDQYRLELPGLALGPAESDVVLRPEWTGPVPSPEQPLTVADRRGCDLRPTVLSDVNAVRRLESYIWCDRPDRLLRLRAAVAIGLRVGVQVDASNADIWLPRQLAEPAPGRATVVMHSSVWAYLPRSTQTILREVLEAAGRAATAQAPLCWLRFEDPPAGVNEVMELRLRCWPDGTDQLLARAQAHGEWVRWGQDA
jgi:hypothetical protein